METKSDTVKKRGRPRKIKKTRIRIRIGRVGQIRNITQTQNNRSPEGGLKEVIRKEPRRSKS